MKPLQTSNKNLIHPPHHPQKPEIQIIRVNNHITTSLDESPISHNQSLSPNSHDSSSRQGLDFPRSITYDHFQQISNKQPQQNGVYYLQESSFMESQSIKIHGEIAQLMQKLVKIAKQLCLSNNYGQQIEQQLQSVIYQFIQTHKRQLIPSDNKFVNSSQNIQFINSQFVFPHSNYISPSQYQYEQPQPQQIVRKSLIDLSYQNDLFNDGKEVLNEGQKKLIAYFFKRYIRILENCLNKIYKFQGHKKLKFLVENSMQSIFRQTLRVSYEMKMIQYRLKKDKKEAYLVTRPRNTSVMMSLLQQIIFSKGKLKESFKILKQTTMTQIHQDQQLVSNLNSKISFLNGFVQKSRRIGLSKAFMRWRTSIVSSKSQENIFINNQIKRFIMQVLIDLKQDYQQDWRTTISHEINCLLQNIHEHQKCIYVNLNGILKQKTQYEFDQLNIVNSILSEQSRLNYSRSSFNSELYTRRSQKAQLFLNFFNQEQLRQCILSGQIYRSQKSSLNVILIPVKCLSGIIFSVLNTENKQDQAHLPATPKRDYMTLNSFRTLLKVIQNINPILSEISNIFRKVEYYQEQICDKEHLVDLFEQLAKVHETNNPNAFKSDTDLIRSSEFQLNIVSNRHSIARSRYQQMLNPQKITNFSIYHESSPGTINPKACTSIGTEGHLLNKSIIQSIYSELLTKKKQYLMVNRNLNSFHVLPLKNSREEIIGMVYYEHLAQVEVDREYIGFFAGWICGLEGSVDCQVCCFNFRNQDMNLHKNRQLQPTKIQEPKIKSVDMTKLLKCRTIEQAEGVLFEVLPKNITPYLFGKMVFKQNCHQTKYYYISKAGELEFLKSPFKQSESIEIRSFDNHKLEQLCKMLIQSPLFDNCQLHIFQHEKTFNFECVTIPILRHQQKSQPLLLGFLVLGMFDKGDSIFQKSKQFLRQIGSLLAINKNLITTFNVHEPLSLIKIEALHSRKKKLFVQKMKDIHFQCLNLQKINLKRKINEIKKVGCFSERKIDFIVLKKNKNQENISAFNMIGNSKIMSQDVSLQLLESEESQIIQSHTSFSSEDYRLKNRLVTKRRTLKDIKKTQFINPCFKDPSKQAQLLSYHEKIRQLQGWVADQEKLEQLSRIFKNYSESKVNQYPQIKKAYFWCRFLTVQDFSYYFLIAQEHLNVEADLIITNQEIFYFQKIIHNTLIYSMSPQSNKQSRKAALKQLIKICRRSQELKEVINKFKSHSHKKKQSCKKLFNLLTLKSENTFLSHNLSIQKQWINNFIMQDNKINHKCLKISQLIQCNLQKIVKRTRVFKGFDSIANFSIEFDQVKGSQVIFKVLKKAQIQLMSESMEIIGCYGRSLKQVAQKSKNNSAILMLRTCNKIIKDRYQSLIDLVKAQKSSLMKSIALIEEEFKITKFKSKYSFLSCLHQRINSVISLHRNITKIEGIEVRASQKYQNKNYCFSLTNDLAAMEVVIKQNNNQIEDNFNIIKISSESNYSEEYLLMKCHQGTNSSIAEETMVLNFLKGSVMDAYQRHLQENQQRAKSFKDILQNIFHKGGKPTNSHDHHNKQLFFSKLNQLKYKFDLDFLQATRINVQQLYGEYYKRQYQYNLINKSLSNTGSSSDINESEQKYLEDLLQKYQNLITKDKLKEIKDQAEQIQDQEQILSLKFQIKSKTHSINKLINYLDKAKAQRITQQKDMLLHHNKQNQPPASRRSFDEPSGLYFDLKFKVNQLKKESQSALQVKKKTSQKAFMMVVKHFIKDQAKKKVKSSFYKLQSFSCLKTEGIVRYR